VDLVKGKKGRVLAPSAVADQRSTRYSLCTKPRANVRVATLAQLHVLRQRAEQWDALPDQHRHARDDQAVDQTARRNAGS